MPLLLTGKPLTLGAYGSRELQRVVDELAPSCQVGYAYSSSMGAFLEPHTRLKRVMHFAELDSDKWRQYAERSKWPMSWVYAREHKTLLEFERRIDLLSVDVDAAPGQPNLVLIRIDYRMRANNVAGNLVYPFFLSEGG